MIRDSTIGTSSATKSQTALRAKLADDRKGPVVYWLRHDLRLDDNPALMAACETGRAVFCIYIDSTEKALRAEGGATRWWLHHALAALAQALDARGAALTLFQGEAHDLVPRICEAVDASALVWNRRYGEAERTLDAKIKETVAARGIVAESFNGHLLYEPWAVKSKAGGPLKVFSPFWRAAQETYLPATPIAAPKKIANFNATRAKDLPASLELDALGLLPKMPDWAGGLSEAWKPGEEGAQMRLDAFLDTAIKDYADGRNLSDRPSTSKLSPHLKFGEISPRRIWQSVQQAIESGALKGSKADATKFLAEIGWREFSYHLLFYFPKLASENFQSRFDAFPWTTDEAHLKAWQRGRTGYPMVDAGMRQLWQTGWMHNRVRMIAASFLIKHLLIDWRLGEEWFWDTLVDADPASNTASWQWVAGSGADAAPYFRIFNPISQGVKFDVSGDYVREFVPELAKLPTKYIHAPWTAPDEILKEAGVKIGKTYPAPIVDHDKARDRALSAFKSIGASAT